MKKIVWQISAVTDPGLKRDENQDNYFVSDDNRVLVVADGMGGMRGGSKASRIAVETIESYVKSKPMDKNKTKEVDETGSFQQQLKLREKLKVKKNLVTSLNLK